VDRRLLSGCSAAVDALVASKTADVMAKITGAAPRQSVPDPVVRAADPAGSSPGSRDISS
jgi:hypothetical protein